MSPQGLNLLIPWISWKPLSWRWSMGHIPISADILNVLLTQLHCNTGNNK